MTKLGKGKDRQTASGAADLETVLRDVQEAGGLIRQAAAKGSTGKKQDRAELLGVLAKTTKGVVELAIDQGKKYVAKKQEEAIVESLDLDTSDGQAMGAHNGALDTITFQVRYQLRSETHSVTIDAGAPCTVIDRRLLQTVAPDARIEKLDRPLELHVEGTSKGDRDGAPSPRNCK